MALSAAIGIPSAHAYDPPPLTNNSYAIELFEGPLSTPVRVTGVAGAYTAFAEGVSGSASNSSAPSVREPTSYKWFDYDVSAGIYIPGLGQVTDLENTANVPALVAKFDRFQSVDLGGQIQLGAFGTSITSNLQQFTLSSSNGPELTLQITRARALVAYSFDLGNAQLSIGAGVRAINVRVLNERDVFSRAIVTMNGAAPEVGVLFRPTDRAWRLGGTLRAPVTAKQAAGDIIRSSDGVERAGGFILPARVVQPWEIEMGGVIQFGPRPLNPPWINPHEQEAQLGMSASEALAIRKSRYVNWPRKSVTLFASILVTGPSTDAIPLTSFLEQKKQIFGLSPTLSPRLGFESELFPDRFRWRIGTYIEPQRSTAASARPHFTSGGELKLFPFNLWGLLGDMIWSASMAVDVAPRYFNWGISFGGWH